MKYEITLTRSQNGIVSNLNKLEKNIETYCKPFNYVVTNDNYAKAKKDRAQLNKEIKEARSERTDFEKLILDDWNPIKDRLMKVEKKAEFYADELGKGINAIDEENKKSKKVDIESFFNSIRGELEIPFSNVFREDMLNSSYKEKSWKEDIQGAVDRIYIEYKELDYMDVDDKGLLKSLYTNTWNRFGLMDEYEKQMRLKKKAEKFNVHEEPKSTYIPPVQEMPFDLPPIQNKIRQQTNVSYMISVSGSKEIIDKTLEQMRNLGIIVEVL